MAYIQIYNTMGNTAEKAQKIPETYQKTCHSSLVGTTATKQNNLIAYLQPSQSAKLWQQSLQAIENKKHLFVPTKLELCQRGMEEGCCMMNEGLWGIGTWMKVTYEPYVYTLDGEIEVRRMSHRVFKEYEVWKVLKAGVLAIRDWTDTFPDKSMGVVTPFKVLLNESGHIRVVNPCSFLENNQLPPTNYIAPEFRQPSIIKYHPKPKPNEGNLLHTFHAPPIFTSPIFSLGLTLIELMCLESPYDSPRLSLQKKNLLIESKLYTGEIKKIVLGMMEENWQQRITLQQLLQSLKQYNDILKEQRV